MIAARRKHCRQRVRNHERLNILQKNVAGLKTRKVELLKRLDELKVDVAAIQEVNYQDTSKIPEIRGWNIVAQSRKTGKSGDSNAGRGGVSLLIREGVDYPVLKAPPLARNDNTLSVWA